MKTEHRRLGLLGLFLACLVSLSACKDETAPSVNSKPGLQSLAELNQHAPARRTLDIQTWRTEQGAKVLFVESRELPMFDVRVTFAAGSSRDAQTPGLASLTNAMLNEGIPGKDVGEIAAGFEGLGADFGNGAYRDMAVVSLRSLSDEALRQPALELFTEVIGQPTFPAESLQRIQNQLLAGFDFQKQNPGKLGSLELFKRLYGEHPYAHPSEGNEHSVPQISREQLQAFHAMAYTAANAVIAIVGDLSTEQANAIATQISAALPQGPALALTEQPQTPEASSTHIEFPSNQTHLLLGQLGIDRQDPNYAALYLGNQILGGGGFGTRLMTEVREKRGLTYGVYSGFSAMQARGPFTISLQTRAELSDGTLTLVKDLLRDYLNEGPTQEEVDNAKREIAGSFPLSTASNADIVGQLASMGFYNLPLTYLDDFMQQIQTLSIDDIKTAMNSHLSPDELILVTVGPQVPQQPLPAPTERTPAAPSGVTH